MVNVKKSFGVTGSKVEKVCEELGISINKNALLGDPSPMSPSGIRLGTPAMTTRNFKEDEFIQVAHYIDKAVKIVIDIQEKYGKKLVDFNKGVDEQLLIENSDINKIKKEIYNWVGDYPFYPKMN